MFKKKFVPSEHAGCEAASNSHQPVTFQSKKNTAGVFVTVALASASVLAPDVALALDAGVATAIDTGLAGIQADATEVAGKVWTPLIVVTGLTIVMGLFKRMANKI